MEENYFLLNRILFINSIIVILAGVIMLFAPTQFDKWTKKMDRIIGLIDIKILSNRIMWGFILLISAVFLFYTAYSI